MYLFELVQRFRSLLLALVYSAEWFVGAGQSATAQELFRSQEADSEPGGLRFLPDGNGMIPLAGIFEYPRISALDNDDPDALFYTWRPNLLGREVEEKWDFYNLINTDRPDFTDATFTVGRGVTIIENGYTIRSINDHDANSKITKRSLPETLIRYGLNDEFEVRMKWNGYVMSDVKDHNTGLDTQVFGGDDLILAFKYEAKQQEEWSPMITLLSGATIPVGTNGVSSNAVQPYGNVVLGWGVRRWLYLKASTGIDWQKTSVSTLVGGGSVPTGPAVIVLRDNINLYHDSVSLLFQMSQRVGGFAEYFSFAQTSGEDNRPAHYLDTGLFIYATNNVQFDVRIGKRLSERLDEVFTGAGLSLRY